MRSLSSSSSKCSSLPCAGSPWNNGCYSSGNLLGASCHSGSFSKVPSTILWRTIGASRIPQLPPPTPAGGGLVITLPAGPGGAITPIINPNDINENLFGSYKISSIKCKALRDGLLKDRWCLLPGPRSTFPSQCAWHGTKGQCNASCPCALDHVQYSAPELAPLATWCVIGYAPPAQTAWLFGVRTTLETLLQFLNHLTLLPRLRNFCRGKRFAGKHTHTHHRLLTP
jgi:hypothetical protein